MLAVRLPHRTRALSLACAMLMGACYVGAIEKDAPAGGPGAGHGGDVARDEGATEPGDAGRGSSGLPCDIAGLIATHCGACHGSRPSAPMSLARRSDFTRTGAMGLPFGELAVARMGDDARPMPPAPLARASAEERDRFAQWVAGGMKEGACGEPEPEPAPDAGSMLPQPACSSGEYWASNRRGVSMNPGKACIACHASDDDGPIVQVGGTVYPTWHEEDLCLGVNGSSAPAHVIITDAKSRVFTLPVGPTGNFAWLVGQEGMTFPIRAKVVSGGRERAMATPQNTGDCNGCHTQGGTHGAPGRIVLP